VIAATVRRRHVVREGRGADERRFRRTTLRTARFALESLDM
jgi:hypothetical protein